MILDVVLETGMLSCLKEIRLKENVHCFCSVSKQFMLISKMNESVVVV